MVQMLAFFVRSAASPALQQLAGRLAPGAVRGYAHVAITNKGVTAGPGGRSSVNGVTATIFGGYGFVGSYVVNELAKRGSRVVVPYRSTENRVQHIKQMGDIGQIVLVNEGFDIRDEDAVRHLISKSNVVINMVGQRQETMNFKWEDVHVSWPERLAKIVADSPHVERFIHFSDLGADEAHASRRLRTKALGDKLVQKIAPGATIVKPAPVVGIEDHFFNYLIYQVGLAPIAPIPDGGVTKVQPTYVLDVADAVMRILQTRDSVGKTYCLGGPEVLSYREIYDVIIKTLRLQTDDTIHVPADLLKKVLAPMDKLRRFLPTLPMDSWMNSADYIEESTREKVVPKGSLGYADLGIQATKVTEGLPIEPVRHYRMGGYRWGDMATVAKDVPTEIKKYYNIK